MEVIQGGRNPHVVITVKCAVCEIQKGSVNHWWMVTHVQDSLIIEPYDGRLWSLGHDEYPVCGQACAQKKLEQFLNRTKV